MEEGVEGEEGGEWRGRGREGEGNGFAEDLWV